MFSPKQTPTNTELRMNGNNDHFNMSQSTGIKGTNAALALEKASDIIAGGTQWLNNTGNTSLAGRALERYNAMRMGKTEEGVHMHNRLHADMQYAQTMQAIQERSNVQQGVGKLFGPVGGLIASLFTSRKEQPKEGNADLLTARTTTGTYINPGDKSLKGRDPRKVETLTDTAKRINNNQIKNDTLTWLSTMSRSQKTQTDPEPQVSDINKTVLTRETQSGDGISKTFYNTTQASNDKLVKGKDASINTSPKENKTSQTNANTITTKAEIHTPPSQQNSEESALSPIKSNVTGGDEISPY